MPLPEQLIERLGRESARTPGWSSQLLMFSGTVFFISLAVYAGLVLGYKPYLDGEISKLDGQIKSFSQQIPPEEQNKLISFYSQIGNLRVILDKHTSYSNFFAWLEKNTETNIYYTKLNFLSSASQLNLSGISKSADDFSKQLLVFQKDPLVQRMSINSFTVASNGLWQFDVTLFMADNVLNQTTAQQQ